MNLNNLSTNLDSLTWASFKRFQPFSSKFLYSEKFSVSLFSHQIILSGFQWILCHLLCNFCILSSKNSSNFNLILRNFLVPWIYWNHSSNKVCCMEWSRFDGDRFGKCMVHERTPPSKFTIIFCTAFATCGQIGCSNTTTHLPCPAKCFLFIPMCNSN